MKFVVDQVPKEGKECPFFQEGWCCTDFVNGTCNKFCPKFDETGSPLETQGECLLLINNGISNKKED